MGKVIPLGCVTKLDIPVDRVLDSAKDNLNSVVLMGYDKEGELYFASTMADGGEVLWLIEQLKLQLLSVEY